MPDPIWVATTPGIPNVADFASTGALGTPVIINLATKVPYYLAPGNAVTAVATGGGVGTVTTVSVTTANGVSGTVATATTTPAISLTLAAITPTTIVATGAVSGTNLSGTNTGDQFGATTASRLIGRTSASAGAAQEITLGTNLAMSGTTLNATGGGGFSYTVVNKTAAYTEATTSGCIIIEANLTAGFTITLPTAVGNAAQFVIKKMLAAGQITVATTSAQTIDGGATAVLNNLSESITIISNNANWDIM